MPFKFKANTILFFFPYYHIGGAEKVHLQIVKCLKKEKNIVIFTDRSRDNKNKSSFYKFASCYRLFGIPNKIWVIEKLLIWLFALIINRTTKPIVVGSNSRFFYKLIPQLKSSIKIIDILHWLDGEVGELCLKNTKYVSKRIIITPALKPILQKEYEKRGIDSKYLNNVSVIDNCVSQPEIYDKEYDGNLKVLYIGRDSHEKRPQLAVKVFKGMVNKSNIDFLFIGRGLGKYFNQDEEKKVVIENIYCDNELVELYKKFHIIYITSFFEGFPMVLMEAMSYGVVPISTDVGGVSSHIINNDNGFLINNYKDENEIIQSINKIIFRLDRDRGRLKNISNNAESYALSHFVKNGFCEKYKKLIDEHAPISIVVPAVQTVKRPASLTME